MVTVANELRLARQAAGMSLEALGERIGESAGNLSRWEKAQREVRIEYVVRYEDGLGLPRGYIFRQAGLCPPADTVAAAIANDGQLSAKARDVLLDVYETLRRHLPAAP